jgi:hypothetical protein
MAQAIDESTLSLRPHKAGMHRRCEPEFAFFVFLVSLREELRARSRQAPQTSQRLPRYTELDEHGTLFFHVGRGVRIPLPDDPRTPEFRAAYNAALVDAVAAEDDSDDWSELEAMHRALRRGTAKHEGQR